MGFIVAEKDLHKCRITSPYGLRWGSTHRGYDIAMPEGTELIAPWDGVVFMNRTNNGGVNEGYGHYLSLYHPKLDVYSLVAHLKVNSKLQVGAKVKEGDIIALSGNTGHSTGPHAHLEIHEKSFLFSTQVTGNIFDTAVDPRIYFPELRKYWGAPTLAGFKSLNWKEIIDLVADSAKKWEHSIEVVKRAAQAEGDLGALEIFKFMPQLLEKAYRRY